MGRVGGETIARCFFNSVLFLLKSGVGPRFNVVFFEGFRASRAAVTALSWESSSYFSLILSAKALGLPPGCSQEPFSPYLKRVKNLLFLRVRHAVLPHQVELVVEAIELDSELASPTQGDRPILACECCC